MADAGLKKYREELQESLDDEFLRKTLDAFAVAYPVGRAKAFTGMDVAAAVHDVALAKDEALPKLLELYNEFKKNAEAAGAKVHLAKTADEANEIIAKIAQENGVRKAVKSKSMTAEETHLNKRLEKDGLEVTETDLGEWIIQLRHEGPSHMVMPAIHLSRYQVKDLFSKVTGKEVEVDIQKLVKVARKELKPKYFEADMGISGANFAIAETGTIGMLTNEGNGRLVTTLPRVHVVLAGLEKLCGDIETALKIIKVLPKNATGQAITSYVSWITGAGVMEDGTRKNMHIVFLDNGRLAMAKDPVFAETLRCIRCGACSNVCPVYRLVGGHKLGHVYIGAIGSILTYFFHDKEKAKQLVQNCINCQACKDVCASGIDLPRLIKEIYNKLLESEGQPVQNQFLRLLMKNRKLFHSLLKTAKLTQKPLTGGEQFLRHLPQMFFKEQNFRSLPALAPKALREQWEKVRVPVQNPKYRVALFAGCLNDFVYPEQTIAAVKLLAKQGVQVDFPMTQSCCGLPVAMMGDKETAADVAQHNVTAMQPWQYDYVLTLCASCASHIKETYPKYWPDDPAVKRMAEKIIDFSSFAHDVLKIHDMPKLKRDKKVAYHAPCHLCRGLGVKTAPRELLANCGLEYVKADEEEVCCGFGGSYSAKFPELSAELLKKKLDNVEATGAEVLVTDCPGCVMQLKGGADKRGGKLQVRHIAEVLSEDEAAQERKDGKK